MVREPAASVEKCAQRTFCRCLLSHEMFQVGKYVLNLDEVIKRAIILEIGQRLRASFREDELPAALTVQLDRLGQLDDQLRSPPTVAGLESEKIGKPTAAPRSVSPVGVGRPTGLTSRGEGQVSGIANARSSNSLLTEIRTCNFQASGITACSDGARRPRARRPSSRSTARRPRAGLASSVGHAAPRSDYRHVGAAGYGSARGYSGYRSGSDDSAPKTNCQLIFLIYRGASRS
jgi:hypothetical protein